MSGLFGIIVGTLLVAVGLAGLGVALHEMMTHASSHDALVSISGIGTFLVAAVLMMVWAR